ncbi:MAG: hypothetical protein FJW37_12040, partial [Acidobacteria bacterium]|nr:hypothetical protein [Acidobacteriota bacterium]
MPLAIRLLAALLSPALAAGAIWPEQFGGAPRTALEPAAAADPLLWSELGFQSGERARYGRFAAAAWRFQDATGAMAAFQSRRPEKAARSQLATLAVETGEGALLAHGNYLLRFDGYKPKPEELAALYARLPRLEQSSLPPLMEYLPESGLVLNSGRYIIGPAGLEAFEPRVPPSVAAFHLGSEAQAGVYRTQGGDMKLAIFSYPTPQIAMERVKEFARIPGAVAKR